MDSDINEINNNNLVNMKKKTLFICIIASIILGGCATTKLDRQINRKSKIIKDSEILIYGKDESIIFSLNMNLRKHNVFDINSTDFLSWSYYAGTWNIQNDTLYLDYFCNHIPLFLSNKAYCDKEKEEFVFYYKSNQKVRLIKIKYYENIDGVIP
jgi:hypothetical protein